MYALCGFMEIHIAIKILIDHAKFTEIRNTISNLYTLVINLLFFQLCNLILKDHLHLYTLTVFNAAFRVQALTSYGYMWKLKYDVGKTLTKQRYESESTKFKVVSSGDKG